MVWLPVVAVLSLVAGLGLAGYALTRDGRRVYPDSQPLSRSALRLFTAALWLMVPGVLAVLALILRDVEQRF